jgi:hypothetical protein
LANFKVENYNRFFICGIDGTVDHYYGIADNLTANQRDYDVKFAKSFVRQLYNSKGVSSRAYFRGPAATGSGLGWAMGEALSTITSRYWQDATAFVKSKNSIDDPDLRGYILTGYSRGAAGIIEVATRLATDRIYRKVPIKIYALILFDCVNETNTSVQGVINRGVAHVSNLQSIITGDLNIPTNVMNCIHFIRNDESNSRSSTMTKYSGGAINDSKTCYKPFYLKATHGGLGGLPYFNGEGKGNNIPILEPGSATPTNVTMEEDIGASRAVAKAVTNSCSSLRIPLSLEVNPL